MSQVIVIANPDAGRGEAPAHAQSLLRRLHARRVKCQLCVTGSLDDAVQTAQSAAGVDAVVAVGGDGTVGAVVEGLMRVPEAERPRLAILGSGTNGGRPSGDDAALVEAVLSSTPREIDVGYLPDRDRYFASTVVLRTTPEVLREAPARQAERWEVLVHRSSTPPPPFADARTIEVTLASDHGRERLRAHALVIANTALYGHGEPGRMEIIALHGSTPPDLPHRVWSMIRGAPPPTGATHHRVRDASLSTSELMAVEVDGEPAGGTPVTLRLMPRAIRLCVPGP